MKFYFVFLFFVFFALSSVQGIMDKQGILNEDESNQVKIHAVTDLSHEFSFYADGRFHKQYLPDQKGVTNWCSLQNVDLDNANLLILLASDDRLSYSEQDEQIIEQFLKSGGGVVIFGSHNMESQNGLIRTFGAEFSGPANYPLKNTGKFGEEEIAGEGASILSVDKPADWDLLIKDSKQEPVMIRKSVGKGNLLISARELAGSHPSARDSINKDFWRPLLLEIASGKKVDTKKDFKGCGIRDLENKDDHGGFVLSYNDYLKPYADAMVDVYTRSFPYIEKRMGVSLSPGMASHITLLATGGGGFSSGNTIGLAVWWGGFPEKEDSMIEFLTHESVHSWVLPFPEVWNEPLATYVGNLVMMDMGYKEEALQRIQRTIDRAYSIDSTMQKYDIHGNSKEKAKILNEREKNDIHWGKSFWIWEELRKENPEIVSEYFKKKREIAKPNKVESFGMDETVSILSLAMGRDLFPWFNKYGLNVSRDKVEISILN